MLVLAAAAAGQAKAEELDGDILALKVEFQDTGRELDDLLAEDEALSSDDPRVTEIRGREAVLVDRRREIREEMADLEARTPEGLSAKAAVVFADFRGAADHRFPVSYNPQAALVASLARDILGRVG
ncbi:hypothetical protein ACELLULO517_27450 [Acidisoma cellulosilytica]|uniref:Uncharacterized protein n=1 Tax=Acidisoma cellulosilyticum TaxID=2802395 RepID=A0A963Z7N0_9PROT|nr:hypothetical protein [Acidisoma cellulosilyticum]MCB8884004.1 hypothetical protein [Acidisoma cellulosilyticum]